MKHIVPGSAAWVAMLRERGAPKMAPIPQMPDKAKRGSSVARGVVLLPLAEYHGYPCPYCKNPMLIGSKHPPTRDHAIPRSRGGKLNPENRVIVCGPCNNEKADMTHLEYKKFLRLVADIPLAAKAARHRIWRQVRLGG